MDDVKDLTDRELLEELVIGLRAVRSDVAKFGEGIAQMGNHPVLGKLFGGLSGMLG